MNHLSLNEVLGRLGYTTAPGHHGTKSVVENATVIFEGDARQVWEWLRKTGQIHRGKRGMKNEGKP